MGLLTLLAFFHLCCPPPWAPDPPAWLVRTGAYQEATRRALVDLDVIAPDAQPAPFALAYEPGAWLTLDNLRAWVAEAWGCPHSDQAERFRMPPGLPFELLVANRRLQDYLEWRAVLEPHHAAACATIVAACQDLHAVWDAVDDVQRYLASGERYRVRAALARLRRLLPPDDWESGSLPPHVPVWLLPRH